MGHTITVGGLELSQCSFKPSGKLCLFRAAAEWPEHLAALLPPSGGQLLSLDLNSCQMGPAGMDRCPDGLLGQLTCLSLFQYEQFVSEGALEALMKQAPALCDLTVNACELEEVADCIAQRQGLTRLLLEDNRLDRLPQGPYFKSLVELRLDWNKRLQRLPAGLKAATALSKLSLTGMKSMQLSIDLLAALPALRWVDVSGSGVPRNVQRALRELRPQLLIEDGPGDIDLGSTTDEDEDESEEFESEDEDASESEDDIEDEMEDESEEEELW
jgi:hypothetical protein